MSALVAEARNAARSIRVGLPFPPPTDVLADLLDRCAAALAEAEHAVEKIEAKSHGMPDSISRDHGWTITEVKP